MEIFSLNITKFNECITFINSLMAMTNKLFVKSQFDLYLWTFSFFNVGVGGGWSYPKLFWTIGFYFSIYKTPKPLKKHPRANTDNAPLGAIMKQNWKANTLSMDREYSVLLFIAAKWQRWVKKICNFKMYC